MKREGGRSKVEDGGKAMAELTNCKVGEYALVPHVVLTVAAWKMSAPSLVFGSLLPVIGPMHEDREIIGFPDEHWHIDWRFVAPRVWSEFVRSRAGRGGYVLGVIVSRKCVTGEIVWRRRKMRREMPVHPNLTESHLDSPGDAPHWLARLEEKYADARTCGRVCPHRGLPLVRSEKGLLVCSGHGLCWSEKPGELVRQRGVTKSKDGGRNNG